MELHPGLPRYERRHPRQGPKIRGKAMRRRSLQQRPLDLGQRGAVQPRLAARAPRGL
jgi:hypothetical protein